MPYRLDPFIIKSLLTLVFKNTVERKRSNCEIQNPKIGLCDTCESKNLDSVNLTKAIIIKKRQITCADIQASCPFHDVLLFQNFINSHFLTNSFDVTITIFKTMNDRHSYAV